MLKKLLYLIEFHCVILFYKKSDILSALTVKDYNFLLNGNSGKWALTILVKRAMYL